MHRATPTNVMTDISNDIHAAAVKEAGIVGDNRMSAQSQMLPTTDTLATVGTFHHKSICVRGAVFVTPDGTTTICGLGKDDSGSNAEQEDEIVKNGLNVDHALVACTCRVEFQPHKSR